MTSFILEIIKLPFRVAGFIIALFLELPLQLHYVMIPVYAMILLLLFIKLLG